ncbi:MAG: inositol monophosphatase family protein [Bacillota bacterium]
MDEAHAALAVAEEAARRAGALLKSYFRNLAVFEVKGLREVVTEADRRSEELILDLIRRNFPADLIFAEESYGGLPPREMEASRVWFVDPLDGTTNFVYGLAFYAVSICLFAHGLPLAGVVYDPSADELFSAVRGEGARLNGRPIRVSSCACFPEALLGTGFPYERSGGDNLDHVVEIARGVRDLRRLGSAALDLCYVASGRLDGFWEYGLRPWDYAAGWLIVEEAGGRVTSLAGRPMRPYYRGIAATNGLIHAELLAALAKGRTGLGEA